MQKVRVMVEVEVTVVLDAEREIVDAGCYPDPKDVVEETAEEVRVWAEWRVRAALCDLLSEERELGRIQRNLHYVCAARPTAVSPVLMSGSEQTSSYAMMTAPSLCRND